MRALLIAPFALLACSSPSTETSFDPGDAGSGADAVTAGPSLHFRVRANTKPFAHTDGLAGQTSTETKQGIRKLRIYRDAGDTTPITVFDHGKGFVEAGYDDGNDTLVGSAKLSTIPPARYTLARITVTHSKYRVNSTLHVGGVGYPGTFDCVQTLSDDVTLDATTHPMSWYRYVFTTAGTSYPQEGMGAPLPTSPTTGGFTLKSEGNESYYETAIDLTVPASGLTHDLTLVSTVNMDRSFRWEDQTLPGYAPNVYDTTPTDHEPVRRFGANAYVITVE